MESVCARTEVTCACESICYQVTDDEAKTGPVTAAGDFTRRGEARQGNLAAREHLFRGAASQLGTEYEDSKQPSQAMCRAVLQLICPCRLTTWQQLIDDGRVASHDWSPRPLLEGPKSYS